MPERRSRSLLDLAPVLVTGGAGFIGSHVVEALLASGVKVRVLDDLSAGRPDHLPLHEPNLELHTGDVMNPPAVDNVARGAQACIHLAARPIDGAREDGYETVLANILAAINVFEAAQRNGARRVLFASSAAVYGSATDSPLSERTVPQPLSPRGMEKLVVEGYAELYRRRYDLNVLGLRYFNVYGPRQNVCAERDAAIPHFLRLIEGRRPVEVNGDGHQTRDYIHVEDAAQVTINALTSSCEGVLNVGTGEATSVRTLVELLGRTLGRQPLLHFVPARQDDAVQSRADTSLLQQAVGYTPIHSLRAGLATLVSDRAARRRIEAPSSGDFVAP